MRRVRVHFLGAARGAGATIDAEVAQTREEIVQGLRGRTPSPMLFLFPYTSAWAMTMSGVRANLDMIFLDERGSVVDMRRDLSSKDLQVVPRAPCRYVLELPGGWAEGMGLGTGDRAMITPLVG